MLLSLNYYMEIKLYTCKSQSNTVNKVLENETIIQGVIKKLSSVLEFDIVIKSDTDLFNFNECYIELFHRYYFINDISVTPTGLYTLHLYVDVLETYKDDIIKSTFHVVKSDKFNKYYSDIQTTEQKETRQIKFNYTFPKNPTFILVTAKGTRRTQESEG